MLLVLHFPALNISLTPGSDILLGSIPAMATPNRAVLITGLKRSGKDTVFDEALAPRGFRKIALADPVKKVAAAFARDVYGIELTHDMLNGLNGYDREEELRGEDGTRLPLLAGKTFTLRWLLQWVGTNLIRDNVSREVWIDALLRKDLPPRLCVTDVRYPNEATEIKVNLEERGYEVTVLRVIRHGAASSDPHSSETEQASIEPDAMVINDFSIPDLVLTVVDLLRL